MTTKCHKTGRYLLENWLGILLYTMEGRRRVYSGQCTRCGRKHKLSVRELNAAVKENRQ